MKNLKKKIVVVMIATTVVAGLGLIRPMVDPPLPINGIFLVK